MAKRGIGCLRLIMSVRRKTGLFRTRVGPLILLFGLVLMAGACSRHRVDNDPAVVSPRLSFKSLSPGVEYAEFTRAEPPLIYHVLKADLRQEGLRVGVIRPDPAGRHGVATIEGMAARSATATRRVVAAINGDYFGGKRTGPWGLQVTDGRLSYSATGRAAFLVDARGIPAIERAETSIEAQFDGDETWYAVSDLNRPKWGDQAGFHLYSFTKFFLSVPSPAGAAAFDCGLPLVDGVVTGVVTRAFPKGESAVIPTNGLVLTYSGEDGRRAELLLKARQVRIRARVVPSAVEAIAGGPRLVRDGRVSVEFEQENVQLAESVYLSKKHPRCAAGISRDRRTVYFVTVVGRSKQSAGMEVKDLARLLLEVGAADAMMFDGGDSATLYAGRALQSGRGKARKMCNGLAVFGPNLENGGSGPADSEPAEEDEP